MSHKAIVKASEITGVKVKNIADEHIGEINEVVINKKSGKVIYLVLDFGGFLSFGNKFFAIPWNLFNYDPNDDCFTLDIEKERLEKAPGFDKDKWPDFSVPEYFNSVTKYYL